MPDELRLLVAFSLAGLVAYALTPGAIRLARRADIVDRPGGYKQHGRATPCLGGLPVIAGFTLAAVLLAADLDLLPVLIACTLALVAVGTLDDRVGLPIWPRLLAQLAVALIIWTTGYGWDLAVAEPLNGLITIAWVLGITNAFNLIDNMDGAAGTLAASSAVGAGLLAAAYGSPQLGAVCFALAGACIGFLPFNLASPAKTFLGDGGSTAIGFILAVAILNLPFAGHEAVLAFVPLVGLVILDTTLVVGSRMMRGVPLLQGGRDHLTHRLLALTGSRRRVLFLLFAAQATLCGLAALMVGLDSTAIWAAAALYVLAGIASLAALLVPEFLTLPARTPLRRDHAH